MNKLAEIGNRKIEFRGKRQRDSEWVYGYLADFNVILEGINFDDEGNWNICSIQVIPETVGQYIGRKDKNGKKIYEGDIVRMVVTHSFFRKINMEIIWVYSYIVTWSEKHCGFVFCNIDLPEMPDLALNDDIIIKEIEVFGNVFDDPELLVTVTGKINENKLKKI